uniref:Uncharacterized protein n=1 Tax=Panagrolaimus sp. PS1159 TaxID=55785 RepID=A0AC35G5B9_9BILA
MMSSLLNLSSINIPNFSIIFFWISFISIYISETDAKCQIVCNKWSTEVFNRCDDAEVKCATNLPQGFHCQQFSNSRPIKCLAMIPEDEMKTSLPVASSSSVPESAASKNSELPSKGSSPLRPHRYRRPSSVDYYRVDQAPNVELLSSNSF